MSSTRQRALVGLGVLVLGTFAWASPIAADDDDPRPGQGGTDIATPGPSADSQVRLGLEDLPRAVEAAVLPSIDDFQYDDLVTQGTAAEVCYGGLRSGTLAVYQTLVSRFGGSPGTMYYCRERYAVHERPECNGQIADPVTNPTFYSDCWSNHAQGRAFDIMVGTLGSGYNHARGNNIVNFLLASDAVGNPNANARRLGVQQILWNDRCWNSDGDRGITSAATMRPCGIGHFDHVHVDLTLDGSEARTSWWGWPSRRAPTLNSLWFQDIGSGAWEWRTLVNMYAVSARAGQYSPRFSKLIPGDWNSDGVSNEIFAWDQSTGDYRVVDGTTGSELRSGRASSTVDQFINGDFDRDGLMNDMVLYDTETGFATMWTFGPGGLYGRSAWYWGPGWDELHAIDGNSDGVVDDSFLFDRESGVWYVHTWRASTLIFLNTGTFVNVWDDFVVGDLDAQGNRDELFLRDRESGVWVVVNFFTYGSSQALVRQMTTGRWLPDWDQFITGDWDTDGRVDDMFIYDIDGGGWTMLSWHRYVASYAAISSFVAGLDTFFSGTYG